MSPELRDVVVALGFIAGFVGLTLIAWWTVHPPGESRPVRLSARKLVRQATEFRFPLWPDEPDDGSPRQAVTVLVADWDEDVEGQRWAVRHDGASFTATGRGVAEDRLLSGVPVDGGLRFSRDEALAVALQVVLPRVREYWESVRQDGRDTRSTDG